MKKPSVMKLATRIAVDEIRKAAEEEGGDKETLARDIVKRMQAGEDADELDLTDEQKEMVNRVYRGFRFSEESEESLVKKMVKLL